MGRQARSLLDMTFDELRRFGIDTVPDEGRHHLYYEEYSVDCEEEKKRVLVLIEKDREKGLY